MGAPRAHSKHLSTHAPKHLSTHALHAPKHPKLLLTAPVPILTRGEQKAKMKSAVLTRLEAMLDARKLAGTINSGQFVPRAGFIASGVPALDERLGGGWRCGEISELIGARSTGRTSVLAATLTT